MEKTPARKRSTVPLPVDVTPGVVTRSRAAKTPISLLPPLSSSARKRTSATKNLADLPSSSPISTPFASSSSSSSSSQLDAPTPIPKKRSKAAVRGNEKHTGTTAASQSSSSKLKIPTHSSSTIAAEDSIFYGLDSDAEDGHDPDYIPPVDEVNSSSNPAIEEEVYEPEDDNDREDDEDWNSAHSSAYDWEGYASKHSHHPHHHHHHRKKRQELKAMSFAVVLFYKLLEMWHIGIDYLQRTGIFIVQRSRNLASQAAVHGSQFKKQIARKWSKFIEHIRFDRAAVHSSSSSQHAVASSRSNRIVDKKILLSFLRENIVPLLAFLISLFLFSLIFRSGTTDSHQKSNFLEIDCKQGGDDLMCVAPPSKKYETVPSLPPLPSITLSHNEQVSNQGVSAEELEKILQRAVEVQLKALHDHVRAINEKVNGMRDSIEQSSHMNLQLDQKMTKNSAMEEASKKQFQQDLSQLNGELIQLKEKLEQTNLVVEKNQAGMRDSIRQTLEEEILPKMEQLIDRKISESTLSQLSSSQLEQLVDRLKAVFISTEQVKAMFDEQNTDNRNSKPSQSQESDNLSDEKIREFIREEIVSYSRWKDENEAKMGVSKSERHLSDDEAAQFSETVVQTVMDKLNATLEEERIAHLRIEVEDESRTNMALEEMRHTINEHRIETEKKILALPSLPSRAHSEVSEDLVRSMIRQALDIYDADRVAMPDYALASAGAQVIEGCTSPSLSKPWLAIMGVNIKSQSSFPEKALSADNSVGNCWAMKGTSGQLTIRLSSRIIPTNFTVEHVPRSIAQNVHSAPKEFKVYGLKYKCDDNGIQLGSYTYDLEGRPLQHFSAQIIELPYEYVRLEIENNYGNEEYTCLYRFRVHGFQV